VAWSNSGPPAPRENDYEANVDKIRHGENHRRRMSGCALHNVRDDRNCRDNRRCYARDNRAAGWFRSLSHDDANRELSDWHDRRHKRANAWRFDN
jgi:hypothetical protein